MFIVRGINVYPLAVGTVVGGFRPAVNGEFQVVLRDAPPHDLPPLVRVELAGADADETGAADLVARLSARIHDLLVFTPEIELVGPGALPRTEGKARRIVRAYRESTGVTAPLIIERDGAVVTLRLDRPHVLNALDAALVEALLDAMATVGASADVRCLVIAGNGRSFSAGADLSGLLAMSVPEFAAFIDRLQELARRMRALTIPTIAAVQGHALAGGFELALGCDIRVAASNATFGLPDTAIGLSPTSGMSFLLPRVVGEGWARHLLLTGEWIDAARAERIGLVARVVPVEDLAAAVAPRWRVSSPHIRRMAWPRSRPNWLAAPRGRLRGGPGRRSGPRGRLLRDRRGP